jgi:thioredoxin-related protein
LIKILLIILFLFVNLIADYKEGKEIFQNKCSSCHENYIDMNTLKENFFEKKNKLLNLKAPTVNMLAYEIMDSSKKIGDETDPEMQEIEIQNFLKTYLENPDRFNSICDEHILKYYDVKKSMKLNDDEYNNLAIFFMEYKKHLAIKDTSVNTLASINDSEILDKAKKENKLIMVYANSKSCHYCKIMNKEVLGLEEVQKEINKNYIFVKIDVDEMALPFGLKKVYKHITPTFFVVSKEGTYLKQYPGAWVKSDFLEILKENLK